MAAYLLHVKTYIQGHYFPSTRELEILKSPVNEKILEALRSKYPEGMTANDVEESTRIPITTIHRQLDELKKESFIKELEEKRRGEGRRPSSVYIMEDAGSVRLTASSYQLAPGNVKFSDNFVNGLEKIGTRQDEERVHNELILYISKILRLTTESNDEAVKTVSPDNSKAMRCSSCGINHEARDFVLAMLLRLIDRLEIKVGFINLLRERGLITEEAFTNMMKTFSSLTKEEERTETTKLETIQATKPETILAETQQKQPRVEPTTVLVRILCIQKDVPDEFIPFLAIDKDARVFGGSIDRAHVRDEMSGDTMVKCVTEHFIDEENFGQRLDVYLNDSIEVIPDDSSFLKTSQLESRIEDIELTRRVYVLKAAVIQTSMGDDSTKTYSVAIADDSGYTILEERKDRFISKLQYGDTVRIIGAFSYGDHLELSYAGVIEKTGEIDWGSPYLEKLDKVKRVYAPKRIITIRQSKIVPKAIKVTLRKMHLLDDYTRLFLTIENISEEIEGRFIRSELRLFQGKRQFECLYMDDPSFRNIKSTIPAGIEEDGVLLFEPLGESRDPVRFRLVIRIGAGGSLFEFDGIDITK
jgi:hypothetical protein